MTVAAMAPMDVGDLLSFQEDIRAWEAEPATPEKAQQLEQLVTRAVRIACGLQSIWTICSQQGSVWETNFYSQRIRFVEFLAGIVVEILTRADEIVARMRENHPEWNAPAAAANVQPSLAAARSIAAKSHDLLQWLSRPRRPADEEMIRRSQESLGRGEGEAVGDIIARLQSGGPLVEE